MGGDPKLRQILKDQRYPDCFSNDVPVMKDHVVIDDLLTFMHYLRGPGPNGTFTTRELFNHYNTRVQHFLKNQYAATFVIVCDYAKNVPAKKRRVQKERIKQSKFEPLDNSWSLVEDGVQQQGKPPVRFVADCVIATRSMRLDLCRWFARFFESSPLPSGKQIIFDFEEEGPIRFSSNENPQRLIDCYHKLGEADIAFPFYLKACIGKCVVINTIDTDIIPILLIYLSKTNPDKRPKQLCWTYVNQSRSKSDTSSQSSLVGINSVRVLATNGTKLKNRNYRAPENIHVDFMSLFNQMTQNSTDFKALNAYCLTHIFAGNDYVEKSELCPWFNLTMIEQAVLRCGYTNADHTQLILSQINNQWLVNYLKHLFFCKFNLVPNKAWNFNLEKDELTQQDFYTESSCYKYTTTQKQHKWPNAIQMMEQSDNIKWLIKYWYQDALEHEPKNLIL